MIKSCKKHGLTEHAVSKRKDGNTCRKCRVEYVTRRRHKVRNLLVQEGGGCCQLCGYNRYIGALEFHHIDPKTKSFSISNNNIMWAIETLRKEAKKCILLCANCHREVGNDISQLP